MRTSIDIAAESLVELLPILNGAGLRVVGSEASSDKGVVRLEFEGPFVPDARLCSCTIAREQLDGCMLFKVKLEPIMVCVNTNEPNWPISWQERVAVTR